LTNSTFCANLAKRTLKLNNIAYHTLTIYKDIRKVRCYHRKDRSRAMKSSDAQRRKGRCGFTLIELLIVMLILAILAGVVVMSVGGVFKNAGESAYKTLRDQIQDVVIAYTAIHETEPPPTVGTVNISGNKSILDMCSILLPGGLLRTAPEGCISINGSNNDNCDSALNCSGCRATFHYIWAIDSKGNVFSTCVGGDCAANGEDGYQDVWP
jgi:prepilin-type N-terminal cleavage/methylation domain-containing protein